MLKQGKMQQMKRNQRNALTRRELADVRHAVSKRICTWLDFGKCTWRMRCVLVSLFFFVVTIVSPADDLSLWKIQKLLASKKYVDLTHGFAPGIPRWPGFPDETRKTIYWYDKRPDTMGWAFSRNCLRMSANGERTLIRRRISSKACARLTGSIRKKWSCR